MARYQDKKVVILGGTSGMGLATAKKLLDGGARVLVTGRSQAGLDSAKQELGKDALVVSSDARSLTDIDALAAQVKAEFGTIDLLFVNAGFSTPAPLANVTEAIYDEMFNLNAKGPFFAVQKFAPLITGAAPSSSRPRSPTSRACPGTGQLWRRQGGAAILRWDARDRAASPGHPRQRRVARSYRHADLDKVFPDKNMAAQVPGEDDRHDPDEALRDPGRDRESCPLPRVRRDLHDRP